MKIDIPNGQMLFSRLTPEMQVELRVLVMTPGFTKFLVGLHNENAQALLSLDASEPDFTEKFKEFQIERFWLEAMLEFLEELRRTQITEPQES